MRTRTKNVIRKYKNYNNSINTETKMKQVKSIALVNVVLVFCFCFSYALVAAEEEDQQEEEEQRGDGSGDSDENLAKVAANVSGPLFCSYLFCCCCEPAIHSFSIICDIRLCIYAILRRRYFEIFVYNK